ncbi:hypothetical protein scyTo_0008810, partial [Scyliorhinus torazame]|nr:hypothetical protein [Scyliorhinus torazame]
LPEVAVQEVFNKDAQNSLKVMVSLYRDPTQDKIQIVHQTLRHSSKIYSMNLGSVTWDRVKVEHFRLLLDRQLSELEECVRKPGSNLRRNSAIHNYFRKLEKFLNQEVEGKAQVIRQTLDQINKTFSQNLNTAPWDPDLLAIFRLHLNTQLDELNECAREPVSDFTNQEIQQYFQELRKILERECLCLEINRISHQGQFTDDPGRSENHDVQIAEMTTERSFYISFL